MKHLVSLISFMWVTVNLSVGLLCLLPVTVASYLLPTRPIKNFLYACAEHIYRAAVHVNSFWMKRVVGIELVIEGNVSVPENAIIICNHQSWFDIPIIQDVVLGNGPIVKFLVKQELLWVPVIGWICLALDMPRLGRSKKADTKQRDLKEVRRVTRQQQSKPGALLVFPEGTRFSEMKKQANQSPYRNLLRPKSGGLATMLAHSEPGVVIIDITINYHQPNISIWNCLHGDPEKITVSVEQLVPPAGQEVSEWLVARWASKDSLLSKGQ
nr:putative 1-acyl-sn-glycerol-3-phosphate acyltransferase [uncultured bacterium]